MWQAGGGIARQGDDMTLGIQEETGKDAYV